jgi:hypothetical protein
LQAEYEREGIDWTTIEFVDNQDLLDLVEGKGGLIEQLDEACRLPNTAAKVGLRHTHGVSSPWAWALWSVLGVRGVDW